MNEIWCWLQDDVETYPEFGTDLEKLLEQAPAGWCLGHRCCATVVVSASVGIADCFRLVGFADVHRQHEGSC